MTLKTPQELLAIAQKVWDQQTLEREAKIQELLANETLMQSINEIMVREAQNGNGHMFLTNFPKDINPDILYRALERLGFQVSLNSSNNLYINWNLN